MQKYNNYFIKFQVIFVFISESASSFWYTPLCFQWHMLSWEQLQFGTDMIQPWIKSSNNPGKLNIS